MNNDENEKSAEKDVATAEKPALRPRRIVRSASTARAEAEASAKAEAESPSAPPEAAPSGPPASRPERAAPSGQAAQAGADSQAPGAAPERRVFDARAPKPRPAPSAPPRWSPTEGTRRPTRGPIDASSRAPGAIPRPAPGPIDASSRAPGAAARPARGPIDASSRAPGAIPRSGGPRFQRDRPGSRPPRDRNGFGARDDRRPRPDARSAGSTGAESPKPAAAPAPPPKPVAPVVAKAVHKPPLMPLPFARNVIAPAKNKNVKPALTAKEAMSAKAKAAQSTAAKAKSAETAKPAGHTDFAAELVNASGEAAKVAILKAGANAEALVEQWIGASNAEAIATIADAEEAPAAARKAARRALNVLKARGVAIAARTHVARFTDEGPATLEATFLPPDATGTSAITIASREASGRYHIAEVIARDGIGILHAGSAWLSGTQLKESRARAENAIGIAPVAVPVEWARHRIAAARERNATSRQVVPLGFDRCRDLVEPVPAAEPAHPTADLDAQVTSDLASARAPGSATLHGEQEFRGWLPDQGALNEMLQKLGERLGPDGLKDGDKVNAAMSEEMAAATDRFFTPELRAVMAKRMRDAAISVRARKGEARTIDVLATARAVEEAGLITSPPREIPFLVLFFQKAVSFMAQQGGGQIRIPVPVGAGSEAPAGA